MTAPLSMQFDQESNQALGMFNGPLGLYGNQGTAEQYEQSMARRFDRPLGERGYSGAGFYYTGYPSMVSGVSGYGGISTQTGMPIGANDPEPATASDAVGSGGMSPA
jgi:hypothetical protein